MMSRHDHRRLRAHAVGPDRSRPSGTRCATRPLVVGLNCALGPRAAPVRRGAGASADTFVSAHPNAGLAQRLRRLRRDAARAAEMANWAKRRLGQHRRRLLRHRRRSTSAAIARRVAGLPRRAPCRRNRRSCGCPDWSRSTSARVAVRERRRAHQRHRLRPSPA